MRRSDWGLMRCLAGLLWLCLGAVQAAPPVSVNWSEEAESAVWLILLDNPGSEVSLQAGSAGAMAYRHRRPYAVHADTQVLADEVVAAHGLEVLESWPMAVLKEHCLVVRFAGGINASRLQRLRDDARIRSVQPMQAFGVMGATTMVGTNLASVSSGAVDRLDLGAAHLASKGEGVRVAVVDTGMDTQHIWLAGAVLEARNFVDQDVGQFRRDTHGTEVAGLLASQPLAANPVRGGAPGARLLAYKACWTPPSQAQAQCNSVTLAKALVAALEARADIVNLSLSGPADPLLERLVGAALARGVLVLGAVPPSGRLDGFPLGVPGVIAVDKAQRLAARRASELRAPGDDVLTLKPGGGAGFATGSSMAVAQVSAVAALLRGARADSTATQIAQWLQQSTQDGTVDACVALRLAGATVRCRVDMAAMRP